MKILNMIMAHKQAQEAVDRHLPFWEKEQEHIIFTCPKFSEIISKYPVVIIGEAAHNGSKSIERIKNILKFMYDMNYDWYILHEYDSIIFDHSKLEYDEDVLYSNLKVMTEKLREVQKQHNRIFKTNHFTHPPLSMSRKTLNRLIESLNKVPNDCENGFWDMVIGYVCDMNNITLKSFEEFGFSRNTIDSEEALKSAITAKENGAVCYHGIKSKECLNLLL